MDFNSENLFFSVDFLSEQLEKSKQQLSRRNFEAFLKIALKCSPIIAPYQNSNFSDNEEFKNNMPKELPFCAQSIHQFYSWPYAKRKASEWMRALHVKRTCEELIKKDNRSNEESSLKVWSTKSILLWLRSHGHTPLEYQHMLIETKNEPYALTNYVNSLKPFNKILDQREYTTFFSKLEDSGVDIEINVVDDCSQDDAPKSKVQQSLTNKFHLDELKSTNSIEMCEGSLYVREQLETVIFFRVKSLKISKIKSLLTQEKLELPLLGPFSSRKN